MTVTVNVDIRDAEKNMAELGIDVHKAIPRLVSRLLVIGERKMKQIVPVDTGYLRGSIFSEMRPDHAYIKAGAEYAAHVNYGTKPHIIKPIKAKVLAFPPKGARSGWRGGWRILGIHFGGHRTGIMKIAGKDVDVGLVYAKSVHHPGTKGKHFLEKTQDRIIKSIPLESKKIIDSVLK